MLLYAACPSRMCNAGPLNTDDEDDEDEEEEDEEEDTATKASTRTLYLPGGKF